jgi:hypothetical protein
LQNCEEKIPTIDLTDFNEVELEYFLYIVSKACEELAKESCVLIKITRLKG